MTTSIRSGDSTVRLRKRGKRTANGPGLVAEPAEQSRGLRPRTVEDIANEETAEKLALRVWAAMVAQKVLRDVGHPG
jgi:hypothetical protein